MKLTISLLVAALIVCIGVIVSPIRTMDRYNETFTNIAHKQSGKTAHDIFLEAIDIIDSAGRDTIHITKEQFMGMYLSGYCDGAAFVRYVSQSLDSISVDLKFTLEIQREALRGLK